MRRNIHKIEHYLHGNFSINVIGCDISKSEMNMIFDQLSSSIRQIQTIVFVFVCLFLMLFFHE